MQKLFVISGSSGVGKGTVIKEFLKKHPEFKLSISCTTRAKREGEAHGVNYFFLTTDEFKNCIKNGEFLEWAEFSGNLYGTKKEFVEKTLTNGENLILEIDTKGALNVVILKQPLNGLAPTVSAEKSVLLANSTDVSPKQPLKALSPIFVIPLEKTILSLNGQFSKALLPIEVTAVSPTI